MRLDEEVKGVVKETYVCFSGGIGGFAFAEETSTLRVDDVDVVECFSGTVGGCDEDVEDVGGLGGHDGGS
jgi:hypothetical protein